MTSRSLPLLAPLYTAVFAALLAACGSNSTGPGRDGGMGDANVPIPDLGPPTDGGSEPCGNGALDSGEACDDGNRFSGDGCSASCTTVEAGYVCDTPGQACSRCGDGMRTGSEACDDGGTDDGDGCSADCSAIETGFNCVVDGTPCEECGDQVIGLNEECDDGNYVAGDGCDLACQVEPGFSCPAAGLDCEECGDGVRDTFEQCDDGGAMSGDGCSASCEVEPGWDCTLDACVASECGDGQRAGAEECDDGGRLSGDGCSFLCRIEPGFVCVTPGSPCRMAVCGDSAVEAQEECDDGDTDPADGCDASCQIETGFACPTPGSDCVTTTCGDDVVEGSEQCDDGDAMPGDGCDSDCQLEPGFVCSVPGSDCVATTCGDGIAEGSEECDDCNANSGDGCDGCVLEPFFACDNDIAACGATDPVCTEFVRYVRVAEFPAPLAQPQAVHYDPLTRSFVAYGFNQSQGYQEVCLDGTFVSNATRARPRDLVGNSLDGSTYDPFNDRWVFVRQNGQLTEVERVTNGVNDDCVTPPAMDDEFCIVRQVNLTGVGTAGGVAIGDDGRLYVCNHFSELIRVFERFETTAVQTIATPTDGPYLDNLYTVPGEGLVGYYNLPPGGSEQQFAFHRYDGSLVGRSTIPGTLFANGRPFPRNSDGGEAAVDGGFFLVCSEYLDNGSDGDGVCQLFSRACSADEECSNRVPGTACKLDAMATEGVPPYCFAPATARNDAYQVDINSTGNGLSVLDNDTRSDAVCTGESVLITAVSTPDMGGAVSIAGDGQSLTYTPAADTCGGVESFEYTADLGGVSDTALVRVVVACVCGDNIQQNNEECDDGGTTPGDGCDENCRREPQCGDGVLDAGESCDDGNTMAGDGCSPTCTSELG